VSTSTTADVTDKPRPKRRRRPADSKPRGIVGVDLTPVGRQHFTAWCEANGVTYTEVVRRLLTEVGALPPGLFTAPQERKHPAA
jgi:hypothetical protein